MATAMFGTTSESISWNLEKYARQLSNSERNAGEEEKCSKNEQDWEIIDGSKKELMLLLTSSLHLLVMHGNTIQENSFLWNCGDWMRGICKGDSMLFIIKIQNACRRYRIKFASTSSQSGVQACESCAEMLEKYVTIKRVPVDDHRVETEKSKSEEALLKGTVSLATMAQVLSGQKKTNLPLVYQNISFPDDQLDMFIRLCLTDSSFPQFVGHVESAIAKITEEETSTNNKG